ncbi:MAG: DEAD/DEAH box helicase family protein [Chlorobi bacterium]|nr:DEAD/DEAH box helicase family protein [Chlorobiota bacterium]
MMHRCRLDKESVRRVVGKTIFERGEQYLKEERVEILSIRPTEVDSRKNISAIAHGQENNVYNIKGNLVYSNDDIYIDLSCTCPFGRKGIPCKHEVACALQLEIAYDELKEMRDANAEEWSDFIKNHLPEIVKKSTKKQSGSKAKSGKALLWGVFIVPVKNKKVYYTRDWVAIPGFFPMDANYFNSYMKLRKHLPKVMEKAWKGRKVVFDRSKLKRKTIDNLKTGTLAKNLDNLLEKYKSREGIPATEFPSFMFSLGEELSSGGWVPVFVDRRCLPVSDKKRSNKVFIFENVYESFDFTYVASLVGEEDGVKKYVIDAYPGLMTTPKFFEEKHVLASDQKGFSITYEFNKDRSVNSMYANVIFPIYANPEEAPPIGVPISKQEFIDAMNEEGINRGFIRLMIFGEELEIIENKKPKPRLYLELKNNKIYARLRFKYGKAEVDFRNQKQPFEFLDRGDGFYYVRRDPEEEYAIYRELAQKEYGLGNLRKDADFMMPVRSNIHPFEFLEKYVPKIVSLGVDVFSSDELLNIKPPKIMLEVSPAGIDWLKLDGVVLWEEDNTKMSIEEILKQWRKQKDEKIKYIKLADGTRKIIHPKLQVLLEKLDSIIKSGSKIDIDNLFILDLLSEVEEMLDVSWDIDVEHSIEKYKKLTKVKKLPKYPLPKKFKGKLRPYQKEGYRWMRMLYDYELAGILADDMGLGKTVQVLAFISGVRESIQPKNPDLIIVPRSLIYQWFSETQKFTPHLRVGIYDGTDRKNLRFDDYDIILTTYGLVRNDIDSLKEKQFHCLILDESSSVVKQQRSKTAKAIRQLNAKFKLALTGTPVENSLSELWTQMSLLMPGILGTYGAFRDIFIKAEQNLKKGMATPIDTIALEILKEYIKPLILRRTKEMVLKDLPPKTEETIMCTLPTEHKSFYDDAFEYFRKTVLELKKQQEYWEARIQLLSALLRLRQAAIHPKILDSKYNGPSGKFEQLLILLNDIASGGHKALVFSSFLKPLELLADLLTQQGWQYSFLSGKTPAKQRQKAIQEFSENPDVPFFLLTLKAGGFGLNLTAADYVIILDPWWNPAVERQAADRAHRMGQQKPVFVFKLISKDTIEEQVFQLQQKKQQLFDMVMSNDSKKWESISADQLEQIIKVLVPKLEI